MGREENREENIDLGTAMGSLDVQICYIKLILHKGIGFKGRMYWQFIVLLSYRQWLLFYTDNVCSCFLLLVCIFFFIIKKWKHTLKKMINKIILINN